MFSLGLAIILIAFVAMAGLFFYFGVEDKNPACIILGTGLLGGILIMMSIQ